MDRILIVGATSAIATAVARLYAREGAVLYLLGRDEERLQSLVADLRVRGAAEVHGAAFDAARTADHGDILRRAFETLGTVDLVLLAHGSLPRQAECERDVSLGLRELEVNGIGSASLLAHIANHMEAQGSGCIAAVTSVAGERGRASNYLYGSAKALVSTYLQGLRGRLHARGVRVLDIRPGFVDTPMTAGLAKGALWADPERVAADIVRAVDKRRELLYTPFFWRYIMWLIRLLPEPVFKRLSL